MNDQIEIALVWVDSEWQAGPHSEKKAAIVKNFSSWPFIQERLIRRSEKNGSAGHQKIGPKFKKVFPTEWVKRSECRGGSSKCHW